MCGKVEDQQQGVTLNFNHSRNDITIKIQYQEKT